MKKIATLCDAMLEWCCVVAFFGIILIASVALSAVVLRGVYFWLQVLFG